MKDMNVEVLPDDGLKNVIANYERRRLTSDPVYLAALRELDRRKAKGLDFEKTKEIVRAAAVQRRFLSYKEVADASGVAWTQVRYEMNRHLGRLVTYAHRHGWPLLSAIVVNQQHVATGKMEESSLKGFITIARELGYRVTDEEAFLRDMQGKVFDWAASGNHGD